MTKKKLKHELLRGRTKSPDEPNIAELLGTQVWFDRRDVRSILEVVLVRAGVRYEGTLDHRLGLIRPKKIDPREDGRQLYKDSGGQFGSSE